MNVLCLSLSLSLSDKGNAGLWLWFWKGVKGEAVWALLVEGSGLPCDDAVLL